MRIDYKLKIKLLMESFLPDFSLDVDYDSSHKFYFVVLRNVKTSRTLNFTSRNYKELFIQLSFFEFGLSWL